MSFLVARSHKSQERSNNNRDNIEGDYKEFPRSTTKTLRIGGKFDEGEKDASNLFVTQIRTRSARHQSNRYTQIQTPSENIPNMYEKLGKLVDNFDDVMKELVVRQENNFMSAYKMVMNNVSKEVADLKENFRNEKIKQKINEKIHKLKNELNSFRDECFRLTKENKQYKEKIKELKSQIQVLNDESVMDNYLLKRKIIEIKRMKELQELGEDLKEAAKGRDTSPRQVSDIGRANLEKGSASTPLSKAKGINKTFMLPDSLKKLAMEIGNIYKKPSQTEEDNIQGVYELVTRAFRDKENLLNSLKSELSNLTKKYKSAIKQSSNLAVESGANSELYKLFVESVEETKKEIFKRKQISHSMERKAALNIEEMADFHNEISKSFKLSDIKKNDMVKLILKLFGSPRFLKIVEAKVFSFPCCRNIECLTSWGADDLSKCTGREYEGDKTANNDEEEGESEPKSVYPIVSPFFSREEGVNVSFQNLSKKNKSSFSASKEISEKCLLNTYFIKSGEHSIQHKRTNSLNKSSNVINNKENRHVSKEESRENSVLTGDNSFLAKQPLKGFSSSRVESESLINYVKSTLKPGDGGEVSTTVNSNLNETNRKVKSSSLHRLPNNMMKQGN